MTVSQLMSLALVAVGVVILGVLSARAGGRSGSGGVADADRRTAVRPRGRRVVVRCGDFSRFSSIVSFRARVSSCGREIGSFDPAAVPAALPAGSRRMEEFLDSGLRIELCRGDLRAGGCSLPRMLVEARAGPGPGFARAPGAPARRVPARLALSITNDELLALVRFLKFSGGRTAVPALGWWMARGPRGLPRAAAAAAIRSIPCSFPFRSIRSGRERAATIRRRFSPARSPSGSGSRSSRAILVRIRNTKSSIDARIGRAGRERGGAFGLERRDLVTGQTYHTGRRSRDHGRNGARLRRRPRGRGACLDRRARGGARESLIRARFARCGAAFRAPGSAIRGLTEEARCVNIALLWRDVGSASKGGKRARYQQGAPGGRPEGHVRGRSFQHKQHGIPAGDHGRRGGAREPRHHRPLGRGHQVRRLPEHRLAW